MHEKRVVVQDLEQAVRLLNGISRLQAACPVGLGRLQLIRALVCWMLSESLGQRLDRALSDLEGTLKDLFTNSLGRFVCLDFLDLIAELMVRITFKEPSVMDKEKCFTNAAR